MKRIVELVAGGFAFAVVAGLILMVMYSPAYKPSSTGLSGLTTDGIILKADGGHDELDRAMAELKRQREQIRQNQLALERLFNLALDEAEKAIDQNNAELRKQIEETKKQIAKVKAENAELEKKERL